MLTPEDLEEILIREKSHIAMRISELLNNECYHCQSFTTNHYEYYQTNGMCFCTICDKCYTRGMVWINDLEKEGLIRELTVQEVFMIKVLC